LPRIDLPKFSGEFSEWESFRNAFEALIGSNDEITNTLKLYYSCVSDAAAVRISAAFQVACRSKVSNKAGENGSVVCGVF